MQTKLKKKDNDEKLEVFKCSIQKWSRILCILSNGVIINGEKNQTISICKRSNFVKAEICFCGHFFWDCVSTKRPSLHKNGDLSGTLDEKTVTRRRAHTRWTNVCGIFIPFFICFSLMKPFYHSVRILFGIWNGEIDHVSLNADARFVITNLYIIHFSCSVSLKSFFFCPKY